MTVVYPLTKQIEYEELRYSLRSLEMFLGGDYEVVIVGDEVPEWINNVTIIHLPDVRGRKQLSIKKKIVAGIHYAGGEILFMNDDIYLLRPQSEFPYYFNGTLVNYSESGSKPLMKELQGMGKPIKHFDGHYPLIYGEDFREILYKFSDDTIIKSAYCNYKEIPGVESPDNKVLRKIPVEGIRKFIQDKSSFSTGLYSQGPCMEVLEELFPEPSKYEI